MCKREREREREREIGQETERGSGRGMGAERGRVSERERGRHGGRERARDRPSRIFFEGSCWLKQLSEDLKEKFKLLRDRKDVLRLRCCWFVN